MEKLFGTSTINSLPLKNRFIRSATWEGMCEKDGRPTQKLMDFYSQLTAGGVGLIITGYATVREDGRQLPRTLGMHNAEFGKELNALTDTVHKNGGKICIQLVHAGGQTDSQNCGTTPIAPSAIETDQYPEKTREMTTEDIQNIIECFGQSAKRAKKYGFDGIQLHGAHGYLINQFLSPLTNKRQDKYGGNDENRCRFLLEVYRTVRQNVGKNFPVMIKLNSSDFLPGGLDLPQSLLAARLLDNEGIDCIEISGGTPASGKKSAVRMNIKKKDQEGYHLPFALEFKKQVNCPLMVVGGMRSLDVMQQAVTQGAADYISMARPLIRQPDLINLFQSGKSKKADCISCNGCFLPGIKHGGIRCVIREKEEKNQARSAD